LKIQAWTTCAHAYIAIKFNICYSIFTIELGNIESVLGGLSMSETFEEVKHHASKGDVCHDAEQSAF
jgi:hypothetical protein